MWETVEELKAEEDMYMIAVRVNPAVFSGGRIALAGLGWQPVSEALS